MKYDLIAGIHRDLDEARRLLAVNVKAKIADGWIPMGQPFSQSTNHHNTVNEVGFFQCMVQIEIVVQDIAAPDERPPSNFPGVRLN